METADLIGYTAGFINLLHLLPQVIKSTKTKSTRDISLAYAVLHVVGLLLWMLYGVVILSYPVIIVHFIEAAMAAWIVYLKIKYG